MLSDAGTQGNALVNESFQLRYMELGHVAFVDCVSFCISGAKQICKKCFCPLSHLVLPVALQGIHSHQHAFHTGDHKLWKLLNISAEAPKTNEVLP